MVAGVEKQGSGGGARQHSGEEDGGGGGGGLRRWMAGTMEGARRRGVTTVELSERQSGEGEQGRGRWLRQVVGDGGGEEKREGGLDADGGAGRVEIGDRRGRGRRGSGGNGGGARLGGPGSDGPWRWIRRGRRWIAAAVRTGEERENQGCKNEGGDEKMPCWPNEIGAEGSRGKHGSDHVARWGKDCGRWSSAKREETDGGAVTATKEAVDLWRRQQGGKENRRVGEEGGEGGLRRRHQR